MSQVAKWATAVVAAHAAVSALHGLAHVRAGVPVFSSLLDVLFIPGVITLAPVLAVVLLWTPFRRAGAWLLLVSLAGALVFGALNHYVAPGPDHVSQIPEGGWGALFHATAALLVVTELLGCGVAVWALNRPGRTPSGDAHHVSL